LVESDLKRLLTYSSIEHIGIILLGIGTGMIGMATDTPAVALLGFLAALYHALNHSFFKGLLFIGAGSVEYRLKTRNLNSMGGLGRLMPYTAVVFLIGGLAVSAIPPLNGFVSEWLVYKSIFAASLGEGYIVRAIMPLNSILLAVVGALSLMVAIKMYAGIFTGPTRSEQAAQAKEVPGSMIFSMSFLAVGCLLLGLGAPLVVPYLSNVVFDLLKVPAQTVTTGIWEAQLVTVQTILSIPLIAVLLVSLLVVPLIIVLIYGGFRAGRRQNVEPWSCGYGYKSHMSVTASSFDQPVRVSFPPFYKLRTLVVKPFRMIASAGRSVRAWIARVEPVIESSITRPTVRLLDTAGQWIQALQMGDIRVYCLYIIVTLTILLIAVFGRGGL
jgi:hydrogenase-4 component B